MPPRGSRRARSGRASTSTSRTRSQERGASEDEAEEIAARTVNKERARSGEAQDVVEALARGHLVGPSRRPPQPPQGPARAHARPALRGGEESEHRRALEDDARPSSSARWAGGTRRVRPRFSARVSVRDGRGTWLHVIEVREEGAHPSAPGGCSFAARSRERARRHPWRGSRASSRRTRRWWSTSGSARRRTRTC